MKHQLSINSENFSGGYIPLTEEMNSELTQYILENTRAGVQRTDLEKSLLAANWSPTDIAAAFAAAITPPPTALNQATKPALDIPMPPQTSTTPEPAPTPPLSQTEASVDFLAEMKRHRSVVTEGIASPSESTGVENDRVSGTNYQSLKTASPSGSGMASLLLQTGIVKTTTQANAVLISVVGIAIALIVWLNWPKSSVAPATSSNQPSSVATP